MAKLNSDGISVTVEKGDTLSAIARDFSHISGGLSQTQLASINGISNPNLIYVGQIIKLKADSSTKPGGGSTNNSQAKITAFGLQSDTDNTLFAVWQWTLSDTENYEIEWYYSTGDRDQHTGYTIWFVGNKSTTEDKQSTYSIPSNAEQIKFRVKPVSKTHKVNDEDVAYWTANWSSYVTYNTKNNPPKVPPVPRVEVDKYKLIASLENLDVDGNFIQFQIVANQSSKVYKNVTAKIMSDNTASMSCDLLSTDVYRIRCRSSKDERGLSTSFSPSAVSEWSAFSEKFYTIPDTVARINVCEAVKDMINESRLEGRAEGKAEGRVEGKAEGKIQMLKELVKDGTLSVVKAAAKANMTAEQFKKELDKEV